MAVWGPGLEGWAASREMLAGRAPYVPGEARLPVPGILSANERRRTGAAVRLALSVSEQAAEMSGVPAETLRSVFGSANGDGAVVHAILDTLSAGDRQVSPTQFHNSVHNAAAGYWTIATGSRQAATCLGCQAATFPASLLKAMAELQVERQALLLSLYDAPLPWPLPGSLGGAGEVIVPFACALVLVPEPGPRCLAAIAVRYRAAAPETGSDLPRQAALLGLSRSNPAARALPLLEALAGDRDGQMQVAYLDGRLEIDLTAYSG